MSEEQPERFRTLQEVRFDLGGALHSPGLVASSKSVVVAASFVFFAIVVSVFGLIFIPWVQTVQGGGRLIAYLPNDRQQTLEATVDGQIGLWHVAEGSHVKKDDVIVEITDFDPNLLGRVELERDAALAKLNAAQKSLEISLINMVRQGKLFKEGLSARRAVEMAEIEIAKFTGDIATATADLTRIETKLSRQSSQRVLAPRDGIIQKILTPEGGVFVKQGDLLASIVPETNARAVELFIYGNDLPIVSVGRPVRLQFEGWPAIQFSGWPSVAVGTFGGTVALIDPSDDGTGKFRVLIVPDNVEEWPEAPYLRQGVRAVGWIMLDSVQLGWELWRRFNAFPITSSQAPPVLKRKGK